MYETKAEQANSVEATGTRAKLPPAPSDEPLIHTLQVKLGVALSSLHERITSHEKKISPILRPCERAQGSQGPSLDASPLACVLLEFVERAETAGARLAEITDRVEV